MPPKRDRWSEHFGISSESPERIVQPIFWRKLDWHRNNPQHKTEGFFSEFGEDWVAGDFFIFEKHKSEKINFYINEERIFNVTINKSGLPLIGDISGLSTSAISSRHTEFSTSACENECRDWLLQQFVADSKKLRSKGDFRKAALLAFGGRLTERGFNLRVWPELAKLHGRDGAGAKRKS